MSFFKVAILFTFSLIIIACTFSDNAKKEHDRNFNFMKMSQDTDSLLLIKLKEIKKQLFIGESVASFLSDSLIARFKNYTFIDEKPGVVSYLILEYSNKVYIEIEVKKYVHMNLYDESRQWKLAVYEKETIGEIRVLYDGKIIEEIK